MKHIFTRFWPTFFIFVVWFIFSSPYFLKGLVPFPSKYQVTFFPPWSAAYGMPVKNNAMPDVITQIYPWKRLTIETWKMGQVPLWNPYSFSGTPHLANYQSAVLSPINLLFFILPEVDAWSIMILLQPLLAGLFMYFLLRTLERSKSASLIGSIAFMFCGFMTVWMAYGTLGWAILWLPLALAGASRQFNRRSWWNIVLVSMSLAFSFVSGHFQMSVYVLIAVVAYILYEAVRRKAVKSGIKLIFAVVMGLLLTAPQLLPSMEAYRNSVRSQLFTQGGGIAWHYLVTLFAPDFYGNPVTRNDWYGFYAEWASYVGVIPLLLAVFAMLRKKVSIEWFFLILGGVALLIATPSPFNWLIVHLRLPAISTSYSARIIVLVSFSLSALAGFGLDGLVEDWQKRRFASLRWLCLITGAFLVSVWAVIFVLRPLPIDKLLIARRNLYLPTGLSLAALGLFVLGFIRSFSIKKFIPFILIGIVAFDMLRYVSKWMPFDPRQYVFPTMKMLEYMPKEAGVNRVLGNFGGEMAAPFHLMFTEGYDAVYQRRYGEFMSSVKDGYLGQPERSVVQFPKSGLFAEQTLQLLGVKYYIHKKSDARNGWVYPFWQLQQYVPIYSDEYFEVYRNDKVLPRAFLVSSYTIATADQKILDTLYDPAFDMRNRVILEEKPAIEPTSGEGTAGFVRYSPNEIIMKTTSAAPKLLFLSDVYDKGWKATIDGNKTRLYRADYDFRAVSLPAGEHTIRMFYWPESFQIGLWLAFSGFILLIYAHRHL
ncbi:YfhO family protein [Candidatus Gottesmanbacteria bacterium]|nr:YfhO family protein [Candidatus Gottesmanbacteria bacterium]